LLQLPQQQEGLVLGGNALRLLRQVRMEGDEKIKPIKKVGAGLRRTGHPVGGHLPPPVQVEYEL